MESPAAEDRFLNAATLTTVAGPHAEQAPIGVFDSGVGGLSVLRALQAELPYERFVYVADSGYAPYGERDEAHVLQRAQTIARYLTQHQRIKLLVVACNTATAAAIHTLRLAYPALPVVGIEPALKPAAASTTTGLVAVLATRSTLNSYKFHHLQRHLPGSAHLVVQPCDGLATAIERNDQAAIAQLCTNYLGGLGRFGGASGAIDSLVLGCTHYPFIADLLRARTGPDVRLFEAGAPVARHTRRLLESTQTLARGSNANTPAGAGEGEGENAIAIAPAPQLYTTGAPAALEAAVLRWLGLTLQAHALPA